MIELRALEQLTVIADCGTLSAAAERLCLTQSALSRSMQRLEAQLGIPLFTRTKNSVSLNETGLKAVEHARLLLDQERILRLRLQAYDRARRSITLGVSAPSPVALLAPRLEEAFEGASVRIHMLEDEEALRQGLRDDEFRAVVVTEPLDEPGIVCVPVLEETLCLSVHRDHPLHRRKALEIAEFDGTSILTFRHVGIWNGILSSIAPHSKLLYQFDFDTIYELARITLLPMFATTLNFHDSDWLDDLVIIPIDSPKAHLTHYWLSKAGEMDAFAESLSTGTPLPDPPSHSSREMYGRIMAS